MKLMILGLLGALMFAAPVAAVAAPAGGMTAHEYATLATPAAVATPKVEKAYYYIRRYYYRPYRYYRPYYYRPYRYYRPYYYRPLFYRRRFFFRF